MAAFFSFRRCLIAATAMAVVGLPSASFGATRTWSGAGANSQWSNSTNWGGTVPVNGDTATFGASSRYSINVNTIPTTATLAGVSFTSGAIGGYNLIGSGTLATAGTISNANTNVIGGSTGANSSVIISNLLTSGSVSLTGAGAGTEIVNMSGGTLTVTSHTLTIGPSALYENNVIIGSSGTAKFAGGDTTNISVQSGGSLQGLGGGSYSTLGVDTLNLDGGSTTKLYVQGLAPDAGTAGAQYDDLQGSAATLGGSLVVDFGAAASGSPNLFTTYTTFNLFRFGTLSGSFSSVSLANTGSLASPYTNLVFTQVGSEWKTQSFTGKDGVQQYLVFQPNGNLVVVPEPSTIVFAGVGVAMAGWSAWKKRRMAKVLAKK